jgi:hypothetical protein
MQTTSARAWDTAFDAGTSTALKSEAIKSLRRVLNGEDRRSIDKFVRADGPEIPRDALVIAVMREGFGPASLFPSGKEKIMVGYSSSYGMSTAKIPDTVCITERCLEILQGNVTAPKVLIDDDWVSAVTTVNLMNAIDRMGLNGGGEYRLVSAGDWELRGNTVHYKVVMEKALRQRAADYLGVNSPLYTTRRPVITETGRVIPCPRHV